MCDSFASALASPGADAFEARLRRLMAELGGPDALVRLMCGGVASALASPGADAFEARLAQLRAVACSVSDLVGLMTNGVASRILDDEFFSSLIACYRRRTSAEDRQMLLKFMPQCCAAIDKHGTHEFWRRVDDLCTTMPRPTQLASLAMMRG
jgi:hypothetical protein